MWSLKFLAGLPGLPLDEAVSDGRGARNYALTAVDQHVF